MADTPDTPAAEPTAKKGGLPTILLIVNAVIMLGVLGAVVMMMLQKPHASSGGDEKERTEKSEKGGEKSEKGGEKGEKGGEKGEKGEKSEGKSSGHSGSSASTGDDKGGAAPGAGPTLRLADFVVHLRNPEADRYARFSFELEVGNDKDKETLTARQAQIRDAFISYLSDRTVEDLRGSGGLEQTKQALFTKVSELARDSHVRQLYITDFVIQ